MIFKDNDELYERLTDRLKQNFAIGLAITVVVAAIVGIILKRYYQNLERLVRFDPLTGALNRTAFSLLFTQAVKDRNRRKTRLSLVLIDIDDFKRINDKHGHHAGDLVLKTFAQTIFSLTREVDALCRWGGEEFVLLLGDCPVAEAARIAEKIKNATTSSKVRVESGCVSIAFSAGVVECGAAETLGQVLERADKLMYQAKTGGKNSIVSQVGA